MPNILEQHRVKMRGQGVPPDRLQEAIQLYHSGLSLTGRCPAGPAALRGFGRHSWGGGSHADTIGINRKEKYRRAWRVLPGKIVDCS